MIRFLYTLSIYLYKTGVNIAALFNKKARLKIDGIKKTKSVLSNLSNTADTDNILIHCASQGEHEQAKPIIRWILKNTESNVFLSFFSPSGFTNAKLEKSERIIKIYLPFDTPESIGNLVEKINPQIAIIVKNEWWWNLIYELKQRHIPTYLISATFRKSHYFMRYPISFFTNALNSFQIIFTVDKTSTSIIASILKTKIVTVGDTRIDQVNYIKSQNKFKHTNTPVLQNSESGHIFIYGSVWESDMIGVNLLIKEFPNYQHLIYPHILDSENIKRLRDIIPDAHLVDDTNSIKKGINIIAKMGELKHAYRLASLAYIGGGFGKGVHNVLEASVYLIPTLFGPNYHKSNEARFLVTNNLAFSFQNNDDLKRISSHIGKEKNRKEIESNLKAYFSPEFSPSKIICKEIFSKNKIDV